MVRAIRGGRRRRRQDCRAVADAHAHPRCCHSFAGKPGQGRNRSRLRGAAVLRRTPVTHHATRRKSVGSRTPKGRPKAGGDRFRRRRRGPTGGRPSLTRLRGATDRHCIRHALRGAPPCDGKRQNCGCVCVYKRKASPQRREASGAMPPCRKGMPGERRPDAHGEAHGCRRRRPASAAAPVAPPHQGQASQCPYDGRAEHRAYDCSSLCHGAPPG